MISQTVLYEFLKKTVNRGMHFMSRFFPYKYRDHVLRRLR